jgi:tetratricopeptide (TPR) repeat protein
MSPYFSASFSAAIEQFDLCLSINPTQLRALELKGGCLKQKGLHQEALETFDKFIMTVGEQSTGYGPTRLPAIYVNRGVCFKALGRVEAALSSFTSAISVRAQ